jgi:hypothetical protein
MENLPPVSTTPAVLVAKFAAGVVNISTNFAKKFKMTLMLFL